MRWLWLSAMIVVLAVSGSRASGPAGDADTAFFETNVRPVLVEHCYACHSAEARRAGKLKGGLRLDSREALRLGGDSGPAIEPGRALDSLLIQALRYDDLVRMPPSGKLPDPVIAALSDWVNRGAPDPRDDPAPTPPAASTFDPEEARQHWAYQPPKPRPAPEVRDRDWPLGDIDRFILARLEAHQLRPPPEADRATLIRRLSFDLTGLPPQPEQIRAFEHDPAPDAYERLVDRLLASPRFGERWARHWLDVVRFGESLTLRGFVLPSAWRYRDYVIETFNADRPYDQFVREQVAGDLLPASNLLQSRRQLVATTFLTLGNTNLEEQDKAQLDMDVVDEQIDTLGKAFLAQTIACARCHDHKFDPIPTADYYALAGILANVQTLNHANVSHWIERPLPLPPDQESALKTHEAQVAELEARVRHQRRRLRFLGGLGAIKPEKLPGVVVDDARAFRIGSWKKSQFTRSFVGTGYLHDDNDEKGRKTLTFAPRALEPGRYEVRLAYSPASSRAKNVPVTVGSAEGKNVVPVDMTRAPPITGRFVSLGQFRFEKDGLAYVLVSNQGTSGYVTADAVQFLPVDQVGAEEDRTPPTDHDEMKALEAQLAKLKARGPERPMTLSVVEREQVGPVRIHIRGSVHSLGETVPRGFLRAASAGDSPAMPADQSGRVELAEWLTQAGNPLTARVYVNRAWHWLMGSGLVRTVDNFGTTGEPPSHPDLLDRLALDFQRTGWSTRALVRRIVLSRTYRMATLDDPHASALDPENRLFGRHDRRRLEAEEIRDTMLSVSGRLDNAMGGPGFPQSLASDYGFSQPSDRRSVYVPVFRNALPELFQVFDFANPSLVVGRRNASTVAPQALYLMNSPFVREQARQAARRLLSKPELKDDQARLDHACRLALGRPPTESERRISEDFLASGTDPENAWTMVFQALFASIDFRYAR